MPGQAPSPELRIRTCRERDSIVVRLEGELDLHSVAEVHDELAAALEQSQRRVVDLSSLVFMDSTGLGVLVRATLAAELGGRELRLRRRAHQVRRLLEVTGTLNAFAIEG